MTKLKDSASSALRYGKDFIRQSLKVPAQAAIAGGKGFVAVHTAGASKTVGSAVDQAVSDSATQVVNIAGQGVDVAVEALTSLVKNDVDDFFKSCEPVRLRGWLSFRARTYMIIKN